MNQDNTNPDADAPLRDHVYDGIREYDHKLPNWWLYTLYGGIIWFLVYWGLYYKTDLFKTDQEKVAEALTEIAAKRQKALADTLSSMSNESLVNTLSKDPAILAKGEGLYNQICFTCHGADLKADQGLGLSLVDGTWKYGSAPLDVFKIINEGTPADSPGMEGTGARMIPWGQTYSPEEITAVTAFLISKNPEDFVNFAQ